MATDGPGGGGVASGRQRTSVRPGVKAGQQAKTCAPSAGCSAAPSALADWALVTMFRSVSQKLEQACSAGSGSCVPLAPAAAS